MKHLLQTLCCATALCLSTACSTDTQDATQSPSPSLSQTQIPSQTVAQNTQTLSTEIHAVPSYQKILVDNTAVSWTVYNINDQNYVRLADLCPVVGTDLAWDAAENAVRMTTNAITPSAPVADSSNSNAAFQTVIDDIVQQYGTLEDDKEQGLYYAALLDFTGNQEEDLFISYISQGNINEFNMEIIHTSEIWTMVNDAPVRVHTYDSHFASGGNADYGFSCQLVYGNGKWHVLYEDYLRQMYQNKDNVYIVTLDNGRETYLSTQNHSQLLNTVEEEIPIYNAENLPGKWLEHTNNLHTLPLTSPTQSTEKVEAVETRQTIYLDNTPVTWKIYNVNDENYIRLADLCPEINVELTWDAQENAVKMTTPTQQDKENYLSTLNYYTVLPHETNIFFPLPDLSPFWNPSEMEEQQHFTNLGGNYFLHAVYNGFLGIDTTDYISEVISAAIDLGDGNKLTFYENGTITHSEALTPISSYDDFASGEIYSYTLFYTLQDLEGNPIQLEIHDVYLQEDEKSNFTTDTTIRTAATEGFEYYNTSFDSFGLLIKRDIQGNWDFPAYSIYMDDMVSDYKVVAAHFQNP